MKKWEYKYAAFGSGTDSEWTESMNKLGSEGWELVSYIKDITSTVDVGGGTGMTNYSSIGLAYFKREI